MNDFLKLGPAVERLFISVVAILIFCHISACLWYMLVSIGDSPSTWLLVTHIEELSPFGQYIACFYLIVQTVVTVGYGDLSPVTKEERFMPIFIVFN